MEYKTRSVPKELQILEVLHTRMELQEHDRQRYLSLKKGLEGEMLFDSHTRQLNLDCLVINDLLLQINNITFQIDTLLIADSIYFYEIKNFEGDFYLKDNRLYNNLNFELNNPLTQLTRTESLLRQLLQSLGINTNIHSFVVFINPEFTLFQAPIDKPIILPTQINRYMKRLNSLNSKITQKHKTLANKLISLHLEQSPYTKLPDYTYEHLKKGTVCHICKSFDINVEGRSCICGKCGNTQLVTETVLRSVEEFKLLFPEEKITTRGIHEWCRIFSKKRISRILNSHYKSIGINRWVYFE